MPDTVNIIVGKVQERFADLTSTAAIDYINRVNREVLGVMPDIARHKTDIALVANQAEYPLPSDMIELSQVLYVADASTATRLILVSQDKLVAEESTWEFDAAGTPTRYYMQGDNTASAVATFNLFLHPKPASSSGGGGFPLLRCYLTEVKTLIGTDALPAGLSSYDVYLEGASYYAAQALRPAPQAIQFLQLYEAEKAAIKHRWSKMAPQRPDDKTYPLAR